MFMVKVILFLILSLMFSLTLNVVFTAVLYKNGVESNYINKKAHICKFDDLDVSFYIYFGKTTFVDLSFSIFIIIYL